MTFSNEINPEIADEIAVRLHKIQRLIPEKVRLVAVTKTFTSDIVRAAYAAGIRDFAENKAQEALAKQTALSDLTDVTWHFIGHVQSNKSRKIVESFDWIHSVDSLKLASRLDRQAAELNRRPHCCLQVKLASDPTKSGFEPNQLRAALPALDQLTHLNLVGLMVIPPYGLSPQQTREIFDQGKGLADEITQQASVTLDLRELSMGMSGDFELAIAAGATVVRIGSGLFGNRKLA
ncbi:MAG: YggS family pyridoxal phosphate-dependent enzyme [Phormidesmis sp.]